jgi:hypothetical protein
MKGSVGILQKEIRPKVGVVDSTDGAVNIQYETNNRYSSPAKSVSYN